MPLISLVPSTIVAFDANNSPEANAQMTVSVNGASTPVDTYSTEAAAASSDAAYIQSKPVLADGNGVFPPVYVAAGTYRVNITDANGDSLPGYPRDDQETRDTKADADASSASATASALSATASALSETNAAASATASDLNKTNAAASEAAAIAAAATSGDIYADEATGRAAVADSAFYQAVGSTSSIAIDIWRRDSSSASTLMRSFADLSIVQDFLDEFVESRLASLTNFDTTKVTPANSSGSPSVFKSVSWVSGENYTIKGYAKKAEYGFLNVFSGGGFIHSVTFNLYEGAVATESGGTGTILPIGRGWYQWKVTGAATVTTGANLQFRVLNDDQATAYSGDGTSGLYVDLVSAKKDGDASELLPSTKLSDAGFSKQSVTASSTAIENKPESTVVNYMSGKKWAAVGSSITDQSQYTTPLASLWGATLQELGSSGGSIASGAHYGSLTVYNQIASIDSDTDLVTLEVSPNDFGTDNSTLGTLGDTTTATFYGALYASFVAIQAQAPSASVIYFTPYSADSRFSTYSITATNSEGNTFAEFQNAVREVCDLLNIPLIDIGRGAGFGYLTNTDKTSDGLHPNATGGSLYAKFVKSNADALYAAGSILN